MAKSKIFSGKPPSRASAASIRLDVARSKARFAGISFPQQKPRTIAEKEAEAERLEKLYEEFEEKRREEEEEKRREFERRAPIREALVTGDSQAIISALYRVVPSDEQDLLDEYDSSELIEIAEIYGLGTMPLEEALEKWNEQHAEAVKEVEKGESEVNWKEEDIF